MTYLSGVSPDVDARLERLALVARVVDARDALRASARRARRAHARRSGRLRRDRLGREGEALGGVLDVLAPARSARPRK